MIVFADYIIRGSFGNIFVGERKRRIRLIGGVLFFLLLLLLWITLLPVKAEEGNLDPSFGSGGKIITDFFGNEDYGFSMVVQPDGKIVVVGQSGVIDSFHSALARYNSDGSLDQTFGSGGKVLTQLGSNSDELSSVVLQPDGKIVAAGSFTGDSLVNFLVGRFNPDGTLDPSFGSGGTVVFDFGDHIAGANKVVLQPDGKIIVVGESGAGSYSELHDFALARLNSDGSFDPSFGTGGLVKTHFDGEFNTGSDATAAVFQPGGKLVVIGRYKNQSTPREFALARYNPDGSLDTSFGSGGKTTTSPSAADAFGNAVALQHDGRIVVAGYSHTARRNSDFTLARYTSDGVLDTSFGNGGVSINDLFEGSDDIASALLLQRDGKIIAAGRSGQYPNFKFALVRFNSFGNYDQTFNGTGRVITDFGTVVSQSYGAAFQPDGKIVLAGYTTTGTTGADFNASFALARYLVAVPHPPQFDFDGDGRADISVFRQGLWYVQRSTSGFLGFQFGFNTDTLVPADYDGDAMADIAVWRSSEGNWYWFNSETNTYSITHFGQNGDLPVPGDYDGDGRTDPAVFRDGVWYIQRSSAGLLIRQFGLSGDKPVPADYDGDGKADLAVYRDGVWYLDRSTQGLLIQQFGVSNDKVVVGDYDGDGKADLTVWRPAEGVWYIFQSSTGTTRSFAWGENGDVPTPGDYDGDGKTDLAIYRGSGEWWIWRSLTNDYVGHQFGIVGDLPVPSAYVP